MNGEKVAYFSDLPPAIYEYGWVRSGRTLPPQGEYPDGSPARSPCLARQDDLPEEGREPLRICIRVGILAPTTSHLLIIMNPSKNFGLAAFISQADGRGR